MDTGDSIRLGPLELDRRSLELRAAGESVPLEPRPARILLHLAERAGTMVRRSELLELGWPRLPSAAEQSLNTCIYQIRLALADHGGDAVVLETIRGRGYRLTVRPLEQRGPTSRHRLVRRSTWPRIAAAVVALVLGSAGVVALVGRPARAGAGGAVDALERASYLLTRTGDVAGAEAVLDSARVQFPGSSDVQARWAEVALMTGDLAGARVGAQTALELDGASVVALRVLGMLALVDGDPDRSDRLLDRALALDPDDAGTLSTLAYRSAIAGRSVEALRHLERALLVDPLSTVLHRDAGLLYLLTGRFVEAESACREVLRFEPRSAWAVDCLFDLMVLSGHAQEAARWGRRLMELQGAPPTAEGLEADDVVAAMQKWRMEAWEGAVGRGAYPLGLVYAYAANGRLAEAVLALQRSAADPRPGLLAVAVDPRLAELRPVHGFREVVDQLAGSVSGSQ